MTTLPALGGPMFTPAAGGDPTSLVILLHGYGSNGEDLIGLAPYWAPALPHAAFLSPNAPDTCPGAPGGYQWWDIQSLDRGERSAGARAVAPILDAFIDAQLAHYGLTEDRLALVGFSQGTMMALHVGPRRQRQIAGILGFSGMLADPDSLPNETVTRPPILLIHGDQDAVLPIEAFQDAETALTANGFSVETHVSRGLGHSIDPAGLKLGGEFLVRVLG